jgi:hypothetical protein
MGRSDAIASPAAIKAAIPSGRTSFLNIFHYPPVPPWESTYVIPGGSRNMTPIFAGRNF